MGGDVTVASTLGEGATFFVSLRRPQTVPPSIRRATAPTLRSVSAAG